MSEPSAGRRSKSEVPKSEWPHRLCATSPQRQNGRLRADEKWQLAIGHHLTAPETFFAVFFDAFATAWPVSSPASPTALPDF